MERDHSTEKKIKDAARNIFISKGFHGCTSREIAKEAGTNVALVNYYFKSKENLYHNVVTTVMKEFTLSMIEIFNGKLSLENKVRIFIDKEYEFLSKHPEIPNFIVNELSKEEKNYFDCTEILEQVKKSKTLDQIAEGQKNGEIRKMDFVSIMLILLSNCHFPFIAKSMIKTIHSLDEQEYKQQLVIHKQYVTEMVIGYLFLSK